MIKEDDRVALSPQSMPVRKVLFREESPSPRKLSIKLDLSNNIDPREVEWLY